MQLQQQQKLIWGTLGLILCYHLLEGAPNPTPTLASGPAVLLPGLSPEATYGVYSLGIGGVAGWSVGFTLKKFAKLAALVVGIVFLAIQGLAYSHFITIDWLKLQSAVPTPTMQNAWMSLMSMLTYNLPFAGSFSVGFLLGFKNG
jgi:uncharacterized membrane protein (Fun14 family)